MKQKMKKIYVGCIILALVLLLGGATWLIARKNLPTQGEQEASNSLGVEWYDENGKEFTISTVKEFYEFAQLAYKYDFEGQTIKLGADLVLNEGNAEEWYDVPPENTWESIYGFAGTFDGQGHTISGVYGIGYLYQTAKRGNGTDYVTAGLFRKTQDCCVIKNFKLVNSYFISDLNYGAGCISSDGGGTFESIYTDATLFSQKRYVGGIIGLVREKTTVTNCWFDGAINVVGNYGRYQGGIIGYAANGLDITIDHCLVSGTLTSDLYKKGVNLGGMIGKSGEDATITINDSLVSGKIVPNWPNVVGSVIGIINKNTTVKASNVYVTSDVFKKIIGYQAGTTEGTPIAFGREVLTGLGGYQWTALDFDNYWAVVEGGTPVLKTFAENALSLDGVEKKVDVSWYNADEKTYILQDAADFYGFALMSYQTNFEGKTVKLGADITLNKGKASSWAKNAPKDSWICIGSNKVPFAGTFDGQMHSISGVYLKTEEKYSGLFSSTTETAVIKRFKLKNSYFESNTDSFGSIAGRGIGTFDTIYSDAIVTSSGSNIGGIIGQVPTTGGVTVKNCWFAGSVTNTAKEATRRTGGIVGCLYSDSTISNCLNTGTIDVSAYKQGEKNTTNIYPYAGGMVGYIRYAEKVSITGCLNTGEIRVYTGPGKVSRYGSILGYTNKTPVTVKDCYATSESCNRTATGTKMCLIGKVVTYKKDKLSGYGGYQWTTLDFNKHWAVVLGPDSTPILKAFASKAPSVSGIARMFNLSWYNEKESTYVLNSFADLNGFLLLSGSSDFAGKTVKLGADITVNEGNAADWATTVPSIEWTGLGTHSLPFAGTFDGQMHKISGIYMKTDAEYSGFFNATEKTAVIKNLELTNSYFESSANSFGSIAGRGKGTFDTIKSDAIVVGAKQNVGGFIGQVPTGTDGVTMKNCWFAGKVTNTSTSGSNRCTAGLIGCLYADSTLSNCLNTGTVDVSAYTGTEVRAGGLVGYIRYAKTAVSISDSLNTGDILVNTESDVIRYGSIVGYLNANSAVPTMIKLSNVYATNESSDLTINVAKSKYLSGKVVTYSKKTLSGFGGYQWTLLDFDANGAWAVVLAPNGTPILKAFAEKIPEITVTKMFDTRWYDGKDAPKGTVDDPYVLMDKEDLYGFASLSETTDFAGKVVTLGADIPVNEGDEIGDASTWGENPPAYPWTPIGAIIPFAGTFDGEGFEISGIYYSTSSPSAGHGLFAATARAKDGTGGVLKDFELKNSYIAYTGPSGSVGANSPIGSVVGLLGGDIEEVYSNAYVVSTGGYTGGLAGKVATANATDVVSIAKSWFDGTVTVNRSTTIQNYDGVGGILGYVGQGVVNMSNCLNTKDVTMNYAKPKGSANAGIGSIVGCVYSSNSTLNMSYCLNTGDTIIRNAQTGATNEKKSSGFVGYASSSTVDIDYSYTIKTTYDGAATTGVRKSGGKVSVDNSTIATTKAMLTGAAGYELTKETLNYYDADTNPDGLWIPRASTAPLLKKFVNVNEDVLEMPTTSWYENPAIDEHGNKTYTISNEKELYSLFTVFQQDPEQFEGDTIQLVEGKEYKMNEGLATDWAEGKNTDGLTNWTPIGTESAPFKGTFNGKGSTITGIYMTTETANAGLFGVTAGATIKNFRLENSFFESNIDMSVANLGSVIGSASGTLQNVYSDAIVHSTGRRNGGFVGSADDLDIIGCSFKGTVQATQHDKDGVATGGFVGYVYDVTIDTCLNEANVTVNREAIEGFRTTSNCTIGAGGLVGALNSTSGNTSIINTINTAVVRLNWKDTGACDPKKPAKTFQQYGTLIGSKKNQTASNTYNAGKVIIQVDYDTATNNGEFYGDVAVPAAGTYNNLSGVTNTSGDVSALYGELATELWFVGEERTDNGIAYWTATGADTLPIPTVLDPEEDSTLPDTAWYNNPVVDEHGNKTYTISNEKELYSLFTVFQQDSDQFEGDTIQLVAGKEYKMNEGLATEWAAGNNTDNLTVWTPIGTEGAPFKGTFDGKGCTITGIYMTTETANAGLFGVTAGATIKNFRLENSFFESTKKGDEAYLGSVIGRGTGTLQGVYSAATVHSIGLMNGGLVGAAGIEDGETPDEANKLNIVSCQFNGTLKVTQKVNGNTYSGGFVGAVYNAKIDTCLNTGTVIFSREAEDGQRDKQNAVAGVGGLIGGVYSTSSKANIVITISVADMTLTWENTGEYTAKPNGFNYVGTLIGLSRDTCQTIANVYNAGKAYVDVYTKTSARTHYLDAGMGKAGTSAPGGAYLANVTNYQDGDQKKLYGSLATDLWFVGETRNDNGTAYWATTGDTTLPVPEALKKEN